MTVELPAPVDILPHRPPFLFVDALVALVPGESATGTWTLSGDEWFFGGHFPGRPTLPGVLMCEAIAQVGAIAAHIQLKLSDAPEWAGRELQARFAELGMVAWRIRPTRISGRAHGPG